MWVRPDNTYAAGSTAIDRFDIRQRRTEQSQAMAEHFNGAGHALADLSVVAIDQLYSHDAYFRKIWENRWIRTLGRFTSFRNEPQGRFRAVAPGPAGPAIARPYF